MESQPHNLEFSISQIQFLWEVSLKIRNSQILKFNFYGKSASKSGILKFSNTISMEASLKIRNSQIQFLWKVSLKIRNSQIQFLWKVNLKIRNSQIQFL